MIMQASSLAILVIEDEPQIRKAITMALRSEGYTAREAGDVESALASAATNPPGLVILDLGLPDASGTDFIKSFRTWSAAPVLILSAHSSQEDKIGALDAGADDYLTKPFSTGELLARLRALSRRISQAPHESSVFTFGDIMIDVSRRMIKKGGVDVSLTPIEYRLLCVFLAHPGRVLTQRFLMNETWGPNHSERSHYLRIYVSHLRQKLEADPTQPIHFLTQTGVGYRFEP